MQYHPDPSARDSGHYIYSLKEPRRSLDHVGEEGEAITKEIIAQFHLFFKDFMSHFFNSYYENKEWKPNLETVTHSRTF